MYTLIYDPINGEGFEVPTALATELRLNKGWTMSPVNAQEPTQAAPKPAYRPAPPVKDNASEAAPEAPKEA